MASHASPSVHLAGTPIRTPFHACAFFNSKAEEHEMLLPFVRDGVALGEKSFHIVDDAFRDGFRERLAATGLDASALEATGQLEIRGWDNAHLKPGFFDQHAMLALVEEVLSTATKEGYRHVRWIADMGWALSEKAGVDDLAEYCARLNDVVPKFPATVICTYDLMRFSATQVLDVLRSHPMAVIGGIVHENPFYVPPDEFISRRSRRN